MIAQFGPYNWVQFEWRPLSSLGRWCATLGVMFIVRARQLLVISLYYCAESLFFFIVFIDRIEYLLPEGNINS